MEKHFLDETSYNSDNIIHDMRGALLSWYPFEQDADILCITADGIMDEIIDMLNRRNLSVECMSEKNILTVELSEKYDYIIAINQLEICSQPKLLLKRLRKIIKQDGVLLLGVDNRLGIRYFCGDRDFYTGRNFDSIEGYRFADETGWHEENGRMYASYEIDSMLIESGWKDENVCSDIKYSVFPGLSEAQYIFKEGYLPKEDLGIRIIPKYNSPELIYMNEEQIYDSLVHNGMFHQMANAYLYQIGFRKMKNAQQVNLSVDRGPERAMATIIWESGGVDKKALYLKGIDNLVKLNNNMHYLMERDIKVLLGTLINDVYSMDYVEADIANVYFKDVLKTDKDIFLQELDKYVEIVMKSSDIVLCNVKGQMEECFVKGFIDMIPLNAFYNNGQFIFFDQEYIIDNLPVKALLTRIINVIYSVDAEMESIYSKENVFARYGLSARKDLWEQYSYRFMEDLLNESKLSVFNENNKRNDSIVHTNRERLNYTPDSYNRIFVDIFSDCESKDVYIFGSGLYGDRFITLFGDRINIAGILDNNSGRYGKNINGIKIMSPDVLLNKNPWEYKVIICVKKYGGIVKQLNSLGCKFYAVFDVNTSYNTSDIDKKIYKDSVENIIPNTKKIYKKGYIAGVFDLFHIGHLNMLRRAKEQCEYLIVGVVSDEGVRNKKKTEPFVPFEERIQIVQACQYVDEAVEIPYEYCDSRDAYIKYGFDVQFSGSDYENDNYWLAEKEWLEKHGATMVFFPYTQSTSSTKLKKAIDSRIED